jgi:type I restriction-modification system DNA methylase subunit
MNLYLHGIGGDECPINANKQLNFVQHIANMIDTSGKAAVVVPDNVIFFDAKPASKAAWTKKLWVYDYRTNIHKTLKQNRLSFGDFAEFIDCYKACRPQQTPCVKKQGVLEILHLWRTHRQG